MSFKLIPLARFAMACGAFSALVAGPVLAQPAKPQPEPIESTTKADARLPELTLQANASSELTQDTVHIVLATEVQAKYQETAGKQLTTALDALVKEAQGTKDVSIRTGNYRVWAEIDNKGKTTGWRGRAEVRLESKDFAAAGALASKLSDKSAIIETHFSLSDQARADEEKRLLNEAAAAFKQRALAASNAFGFSGYRLGKVTLGGSGATMVKYAAPAMAMRQDSAQQTPNVPLEPDTEVVSVEVNGSIFLQ